MWIEEIKRGDIVLDIETNVYHLVDKMIKNRDYDYLLYTTTLSTTNKINYVFFYLDGKWWRDKHSHIYEHKFEFFKRYGMAECRNDKIDKLVF